MDQFNSGSFCTSKTFAYGRLLGTNKLSFLKIQDDIFALLDVHPKKENALSKKYVILQRIYNHEFGEVYYICSCEEEYECLDIK